MQNQQFIQPTSNHSLSRVARVCSSDDDHQTAFLLTNILDTNSEQIDALPVVRYTSENVYSKRFLKYTQHQAVLSRVVLMKYFA